MDRLRRAIWSFAAIFMTVLLPAVAFGGVAPGGTKSGIPAISPPDGRVLLAEDGFDDFDLDSVLKEKEGAGAAPDVASKPSEATVPPPEPSIGDAAETDAGEGDAFTANGGWTTYVNARYGTTISYPTTLFRPLDPPANNDGRSFDGVDGSARFFVFAQYDALDLGLAGMMEQDRSDGGYDKVTYARRGSGWYVLSGYTGGNIFYRKVFLARRGDVVRVFQISYPPSMKRQFDAIVTEMARSFGPPS